MIDFVFNLQTPTGCRCDRLYSPNFYSLSLSSVFAFSCHSDSSRSIVNDHLYLLPGLGVKEHSQIVAHHNRLRSRVKPMAANMQKMVCGTYCLSPLCVFE